MSRSASARRPLRPEDDPFVHLPSGFERLPAGTVLRNRTVSVALLGVVPQQFTAWQLLYRTCDLDGAARTGITTVLLPGDAGSGDDANRPLLSYQCAIDAIASQCFPSYALRRGARAFGAFPQMELMLVAEALRRGWAVSIPDHEGIDGRMGVAREPGYRALDAIRAALAFEPLGLRADTPVGLWGYSGGGLAASWAAEMAPEYAPELDIVGVALGSPVGDPAGVFDDLNGTIFSALPAIVVAALCHGYPEMDAAIRAHTSSEGLELRAALEKMSTVPALIRMAGRDLGRYTDRPLAEILALPEIKVVLDDIRLGGRTPTAPLLVVQAVHDQIIQVARIDRQVESYVAGGAYVAYRRDRLSDHFSLHVLSVPTVLNWLADRFAGRPLPEAGTRTIWSLAFSAVTLRGLAGLGRTVAKMVAGRPIRSSPAAPPSPARAQSVA